MPVTEAQKRATAKYEKENYDKVLVRFPKGTKEKIQNTGAESINGYIIKCVLDSLECVQNSEIVPRISKAEDCKQESEKAGNKENTETKEDAEPPKWIPPKPSGMSDGAYYDVWMKEWFEPLPFD